MKTAGGIISLIAGIFGIIAAAYTLLVGGFAGAFDPQFSRTMIGLGWGGVAFSFIVIILGAIALGVKSKVVGVLLIIASIAGAILGGIIVAIFMVLSLIGGILVTIGAGRKAKKQEIPKAN